LDTLHRLDQASCLAGPVRQKAKNDLEDSERKQLAILIQQGRRIDFHITLFMFFGQAAH
jgi:hypothetical protein